MRGACGVFGYRARCLHTDANTRPVGNTLLNRYGYGLPSPREEDGDAGNGGNHEGTIGGNAGIHMLHSIEGRIVRASYLC